MTKLQLAKIRQEVRALKARRTTFEYVAMQPHTLLAASLLERRFRPNAPPAYYLSVPTPQGSRHRYVRATDLPMARRQTAAWRELSQAMAQWVRVNAEIERLLRLLGKGRCRKMELPPRKAR
jgi:hypothetical protein